MNSKTRRKFYGMLVHRDEEYCKFYGMLSDEGQLIVDHKDNNPLNNDPLNLQLLCRRCNYLKNPRKEPLDYCVSNNDVFEERLSKFKKKEIKFLERMRGEFGLNTRL